MSDELDRILSDSLTRYAGEPRAGIEGRILARAATPAPRRIRWWTLSAAGAGCAALAAWFVAQRPPATAPPQPLAPVIAQVETSQLRSAPLVSVRKVRKRPTATPKLEQFPSASPLTPEERAMVALVQRDPEVARNLQLARNSEPLQIAPIEIQPLNPGGQ